MTGIYIIDLMGGDEPVKIDCTWLINKNSLSVLSLRMVQGDSYAALLLTPEQAEEISQALGFMLQDCQVTEKEGA